MAEYTEVLDTNFNYTNIDIYKRLKDGTQYAYKVKPHTGYVMYDTTDIVTEIDPITGKEIPVTYYCRSAQLPLNYNFNNFSFVAVLESEVPADHIFGGGDVGGEPEVMKK